MTEKELFGISEQLDCPDCVNHGGDWDCDHVHCRKGTDTISRQAALKGLEDLNIASFYELDEHSKEAYTEVKAMLKALPSAHPSAEWIERTVSDDAVIEEWQSAKCSACGRYHTTPYMYYFDNYNYCPHCGARMRGDHHE